MGSSDSARMRRLRCDILPEMESGRSRSGALNSLLLLPQCGQPWLHSSYWRTTQPSPALVTPAYDMTHPSHNTAFLLTEPAGILSACSPAPMPIPFPPQYSKTAPRKPFKQAHTNLQWHKICQNPIRGSALKHEVPRSPAGHKFRSAVTIKVQLQARRTL